MLYENVCYRKSFLKEVIVRIDFTTLLTELGKALPSKIANAALKAFPISEPNKMVAQELQFGKSGVRTVQTELTEWNYFGPDREKRLAIGPASLLAMYSTYTRFEELKAEFVAVVNAVFDAYPDVSASRLGIRYINNIEAPGDDPFAWGNLINPQLLGLVTRYADREHVNRVFNTIEFRYDDLNVKYQFGLPNPDFPALMRRKLFTLDIDGYVQGQQDRNEIAANLNRAHARIQEIFEDGITDELRDAMGRVDAA